MCFKKYLKTSSLDETPWLPGSVKDEWCQVLLLLPVCCSALDHIHCFLYLQAQVLVYIQEMCQEAFKIENCWVLVHMHAKESVFVLVLQSACSTEQALAQIAMALKMCI